MNKRVLKTEVKAIIKMIRNIDLSNENDLCNELEERFDGLINFNQNYMIGIDETDLEDIKNEAIKNIYGECSEIENINNALDELIETYADELDNVISEAKRGEMEDEVLYPLRDAFDSFETALDEVDSYDSVCDILNNLESDLLNIIEG